MTPPANCQTTSSIDVTLCTLCSSGYYWDSFLNLCDLCTNLPNVLTCNHDGSVITCDTGFGPSADGMYCNPGVSNCATLNAGSVAICDLCQTPYYFWDGVDCLDC